MTPHEFTLWSAAFASAWFHAPSRLTAGVVHDHERAAIAANEADRMVKAAREMGKEVVSDPRSGKCLGSSLVPGSHLLSMCDRDAVFGDVFCAQCRDTQPRTNRPGVGDG